MNRNSTASCARRTAMFWVAALLLAACRPVTPLPQLSVQTEGESRITAERDGQALVLDLYSETGIGSARIALPQVENAREIVMRLHLRGLEQFTFAWPAAAPEATVRASVASAGEPIVRQELLRAGESSAEPLDRQSPFWMDIGLVSAESGVPAAIPLQNGYFAVRVPREFLRSGQSSFALDWIDFYR